MESDKGISSLYFKVRIRHKSYKKKNKPYFRFSGRSKIGKLTMKQFQLISLIYEMKTF